MKTQGLDAMERLIETLDESKRLNQVEVTTFVDPPFVFGFRITPNILAICFLLINVMKRKL
jgi:hypothetical protein